MSDDMKRLIDSIRRAVIKLQAKSVRNDGRIEALEASQLTTGQQYDLINQKLNELLSHKTREDAVKELTEKERLVLNTHVSTLMEEHIERRGAKRFKDWIPVVITSILGSLAILDRLTTGG